MKKSDEELKKFIRGYYLVIGIPFLLVFFLWVNNETKTVNQKKEETYAMVYKSSFIHKKPSKRNYKFEFYHKGKKYWGSAVAFDSRKVQIGNYYKVLFSDKDPRNYRIIFDTAYAKKVRFDEDNQIIDTLYILKEQALKDELHKLLEKQQSIK